MRVKKVVAQDLPEAMQRVRRDLGADAVILQTRVMRVGGFLGLIGGRRVVEVTAAADDGGARPPLPLPTAPPVPSAPSPRPVVAARPERAAAGEGAATRADVAALQQQLGGLVSVIDRLQQRLELPAGAAGLDPGATRAYACLLAHGVEAEIAQELASAAGGDAGAAVQRELGQAVPVGVRQGRRRIAALVGPTGVGKTTTLAKLAAHFTMGRRLDVALITADTFRIAAVDQLRTYSEILGVPLDVAYSPDDLPALLQRHAQRDLVLVDTAGRSPQNAEQMAELKAYLQALGPHETYLVLALTAEARVAAGVAARYSAIGFNRLLFTKLDESASLGTVLNLRRRYGCPLSYITTGQTVPDDIEVVSPERLARMLLTEPAGAEEQR